MITINNVLMLVELIYFYRQSHSSLYLRVDEGTDLSKIEGSQSIDISKIGNASCVTKFIKTLLSLVSLYFTRLLQGFCHRFVVDGTRCEGSFKTSHRIF